ncbi:MFS Git1p-related glycerophosphoinositol and glycerophosphocholine permease [Tricholoma matsutake]|nr:MFS Git1p-related glycerophosphoinositol and glycerophosphocholine permease [Tricholoma matsutake 945]
MSLKERLRSVSLIFACGTALFSDGYANGVIGQVNTSQYSSVNQVGILTRIYGKPALAQNNHSTVLSSLTFAGTVVGMLLFGYLSDKIGRKFGMMAATGIVALFSGLSAASSGAHGSLGGLLSMLSAMRFLLGIGIGAEYPCGSVSASEQSEEPGISKRAQHRWFALATNTMIDIGFVVSAFVPLVLFWIFGENHLRAVWRLSLGLGVVPALAVFLWRLNMEEPTRFKKDSMKHARIPYWLILRRYGFGIYSSTIVSSIIGNNTSLAVVFGWNTVIYAKHFKGTVIGAFVLDYLGPKYSMISGLLLQALIGFIMSGLYTKLTVHVAAFAVVYGIFLSFGEFGPGNNLGLLAAKSCPTAVRGQFYGSAAAIGKIGAFVGTWAFPPMINAFGGPNSPKGNTGPFWIASGLAIVSALVTLFFIKPLDHDGMAREDRLFREYLEAYGYDTSQMGLIDSEDTLSVEKSDDMKEVKDV